MRAVKSIITITIEVLSTDTIRCMAPIAVDAIAEGSPRGRWEADDGDWVEWDVSQEDVTF